MHVDISAPDVPAEVERLLKLGAKLAVDQPSTDVTVMSDPEGNEFCVALA